MYGVATIVREQQPFSVNNSITSTHSHVAYCMRYTNNEEQLITPVHNRAQSQKPVVSILTRPGVSTYEFVLLMERTSSTILHTLTLVL